MNSYEKIKEELRIIANENTFSLDEPSDFNYGDYSSNIAFILSKKKGVSPKDCAEELTPKLSEKLSEVVEKIDVAGPGFINFFLKDEIIRNENSILDKKIVTKYTNKKILVEHSSPNLFKPFHIGHLMNNIVGTFIARVIKEGGADVAEMSFPSDVSLGIAKAVYILLEDKKNGFNYEEDKKTLNEKVEYFGDAYKRGVEYFKDHEDELFKVKDISSAIFGREQNGEAWNIYDNAKEENLTYFIKIINELGSTINLHSGIIFESTAGFRGEVLVKENTGDGKIFKESEGAIVYIPDENKKDLNTSVFINSEGYPTYEAKDLGLIDLKFTKYNDIDYSFFITDNEQTHHFKIVLDAASNLGDEWKKRVEKSIHIPHGRMMFKGSKMSSRLGNVPLLLSLVSEIEEEVRERSGDKISNLSEEEKKKIQREIALSALRISVLKSKPGININFDPETSLSFEGDSGPYLLYTHSRCCSLLQKGKNISPKWSGNISVTQLERKLIHFEEELILACENLSPQTLVAYLFLIAQLFNNYYASNQIIVDNDDIGNAHRLMIILRVKNILKRGLYVLGINSLDKM